MVRILAMFIWVLLQILPASIAVFLLDTFWPGWIDAVREAKSQGLLK